MKKLIRNRKPKAKLIRKRKISKQNNPDDNFIYNILSPLKNKKIVLNLDNKFLTIGMLKTNYTNYEVVEDLDFSDEFNLNFDQLPIEFYDENIAMGILYSQRKTNTEEITYSFHAKDINLTGSGKAIDQTTGLDWAGLYYKAKSLHGGAGRSRQVVLGHAVDTLNVIRSNVYDKIVQNKIIIINLKKDADVRIRKIPIE